ncbi:hypothetical protein [Vibrio scophthalmi]|uniref:Uncharacterized protein n=1 Tax=Vibrio scophthalmi TaxID=45658 RepID=A0A1E3WJK0_9VIBR|nr:hypothetical protein [Vibrio scophthalmi]ODS09930.1 hypothetical protein VSF3289_00168 [Vibrio scophthalmi]
MLNKIKLLVSDFLFNSIKRLEVISGFEITKRLNKKERNDFSYLGFEVLGKINKIYGRDVFPFFGTLLAIKRDGEFKNQDDFDFATLNVNSYTSYYFEKMKVEGFELYKYCIVEGEGIVEVSFKYKEVNVDIFLLSPGKDVVTHNCPDFRRSVPVRKTFDNVVKQKFKTCFSVPYPKFELIYDGDFDVYFPDLYEEIFVAHYGDDWKTPKLSSFIDYKHYIFADKSSLIVTARKGFNIESEIYNEICNKL